MDYQELSAKNETLFQICSRLLALKNQGRSIAAYFQKRNVKNAAIWGCSDLGERIYEELQNSGINVVCGIDRNPENKDLGVPVLLPTLENKSVIDKCDAIILTPVFYLTEIVTVINDLGIRAALYSIDKVLAEMQGDEAWS
ncbi:MAG: hypothetical protein LUH21_26775 [Clostridiales bacterium]|nr:hypothetical protein [Clostridiales bacterium]